MSLVDTPWAKNRSIQEGFLELHPGVPEGGHKTWRWAKIFSF